MILPLPVRLGISPRSLVQQNTQGWICRFSSLYCSHTFVHHNRSNHSPPNTMFTRFIVTTCKRPDYASLAAVPNWQTSTSVFAIEDLHMPLISLTLAVLH